MNQKHLLAVFLLLLLVVGGLLLVNQKRGERNFQRLEMQIDSLQITEIQIRQGQNPDKAFAIKRLGLQWNVEFGKEKKPADSLVIKSLLEAIHGLHPDRVISTDSSKWKDYDLNEEVSTRMRIHTSEQALDLFVGRMFMDEKTRQPFSYFRVKGDPRVFSSPGWLASFALRNADGFRNQTLTRIRPDQIVRVAVLSPKDRPFVLEKSKGFWTINEKSVDSARVAAYLNQFSWLAPGEFASHPNLIRDDQTTPFRLEISGSTFRPVILEAWKATGDNGDWFFQSSQNPGETFKSLQADLFGKLFPDPATFTATKI